MVNEKLQASDPHGVRAQAEILKQDVLLAAALVLVALGGIVAALMLPDLYFGSRQPLLFLSLLVEGSAVYFFRTRYPIVAKGILLVGSLGSLWLALALYANPAVPFFSLLIVIINYAISPASGLIAVILSTSLLVWRLPSDELMFSVVTLLWLTTGMQWLSSKGLYTTLAWAWSSEQRASQLLVTLRERHSQLEETTERLRRTSQELVTARLRADEARQMKDRFAANISHELRTPLNLVVGFSEIMYLTPDVYGDMEWPASLRRDVMQVYQSSRQLLDMISDVLDLARVDRAELPLYMEQADLVKVIDEAVATVAGLLRGRGIELLTNVPSGLPLMMIDRTRVRQVLLNLLNNASRFTEEGSIAVSVEVTEKRCVVSVSDTGIGIAPDELSKVFGEFYQVDMSSRRRREGAGLGLAISQRFVELHGGKIWAESEKGVGSVFHFSLPLHPEAIPTSDATHPREASGIEHDAPRVIVVERDPSICTTLMRYLKGYQAIPAADLEQAQLLIDQWHPRALIVNASPDELAEETLLRTLRDLPVRVPVVCCSMPSSSWFSQAFGAQGYLSKPVARDSLIDALDTIDGAQDVLVVDDDRGFANLITRFFEGVDGRYVVRRAYDASEAMHQTRERRPDAILLDLNMPGMGGFGFLEKLRADEVLRSIPVIVVTAGGYRADLLARHDGSIDVKRGQAFSTSEVIGYLQAILDRTETEYPADTVTES